MKKMTNNGLLLCKIQADLFANYSSFTHCSPYFFIRRFLFSDLAKRFDDTTVLLDSSSNKTFIDEIDAQFGKTSFGGSKSISKEIMYWIGYVYRYWAYTYEIPSNELFLKVQPKVLVSRYELYHSMDVDYLIERIIEEEHIDLMTSKQLLDLLEDFKNRFPS